MVEKTSWGFNPSEYQNLDLKTNPEYSRQANLENPNLKSNSGNNVPHQNLENNGKRERKNKMLVRDEEKQATTSINGKRERKKLILEGDEQKQMKIMEREMRLGIIRASKKFQLWKSKLTWRKNPKSMTHIIK